MQKWMAVISAVLAIPVWVHAQTTLETSSRKHYPKFSWDKVPVYFMFGETVTLSDEQIKSIAERCSFVAIEKQHGVEDFGAADLGAGHDAERLKKANPEMTVLFYWNSSIAYPFTRYARQFEKKNPVVLKEHPDWIARDRQGRPACAHGKDAVFLYNILDEQFRTWWAHVPGDVVRKYDFDGFFMDASSGPPVLREKNAQGTRAAILDMMKKAKQAMGQDRIIIHNGFATLDEHKLDASDGFMLEHYNEALRSKEAIVQDWKDMKLAARKGRISIFRFAPAFEETLARKDARELHDKLAQEAKEAIAYPLACFLMGAQQYSYFCYNWGWGLYTGPLADYPEYHRPLGKPKGDHARLAPDKWEFKRGFEHCNVWVDLESRKARIDWHH